MKKKDNRLHTVNRWNRPAFMPEGNLFPLGEEFFQHIGGGTYGNTGVNATGNIQPVSLPTGPFAMSPQIPNALNGNVSIPLKDTSSSASEKSGGKGLLSKDAWNKGGAGWAAAGTVSNVLDAVPTGDPRGLWDTLDPVYHLAGGRESGVGNAMSDIGVSLTKAGLSSGQPWLAVAGAGAKVVGGLTNAAFGIKTDKEGLERANQSIAANNNFVSKASSFDDIRGPQSMTNTNVYEGGWFSGGKADRKNQELAERMKSAYSWADRSVGNNIYNLAQDQLNDSLRNYAAFGGPLEQLAMTGNDGMGAINYGFMSDYLTAKKQQNEIKNKTTGITSMPAFMKGFALGGDLQTHGADWTNGLLHIDEGKSHELNPNAGVQIGVDRQGVPNLVEEGERIFNDYVYSKRIMADGGTLDKFHLSKKKKISFADLAEYLEKESQERPNDPISLAGLQANMSMLADEQERQKQEMEAQRAREAFEALPPEQQTAIMQQAAQQEAMAQEAAAELQQSTEQPAPEEATVMGQQLMADGSIPNIGAVPQMNACGGKLYKKGGYLWDEFFKKTNEYSKKQGKNANRYQIDKDYDGDIAELEASEAYKNFTDYILNKATDEERKRYFEWVDANTGRNNKYLINGELRPDWRENFEGARTDGLYGIQHYVPDYDPELEVEATAADIKAAQPRIFHAMEGDEDYIQGELDPKVVGAETRRVTLPNGDTVIYHGQPTAETADAATEGDGGAGDGNRGKTYKPKYQHTLFGIEDLGPFAALAMQGLGIGRSDTSGLEAAANSAGNVALADWMPRGDFMTYVPTDPWRWTMPILANSRATDRNIMNTSGGNRGTAMAGMIANGYNTNIALGEAGLKGEDANFDRRLKVGAHNADVNKSNQGEYGQTSRFNASAINEANQRSAQLMYNAAHAKMLADNDWYGSLYRNVDTIFENIGKHKKENRTHNMLADMVANGLMGVMTPDSPVGSRYLQYANVSKEGGKSKKKRRGLTF